MLRLFNKITFYTYSFKFAGLKHQKKNITPRKLSTMFFVVF